MQINEHIRGARLGAMRQLEAGALCSPPFRLVVILEAFAPFTFEHSSFEAGIGVNKVRFKEIFYRTTPN